jgi:hypothetical protein
MKQKIFAFVIATSTAITLACSASNPTAPANTQAGGAAPDGSTLKASPPTAVSPIGGIELEDLTPVLTIRNSVPEFVSSLPLTYVFEVLNSANQVVYRSSPVDQGSGGQTSHEIIGDLNTDQVHTWRAFATYQTFRSGTSPAASFKTLSRFGVSCAHTGSPIGIVACRHAQHGGMDHEEVVEFLREVAYDLNRLGISDHGGFGILVKNTGNNCGGYSCDIICEGNGGDQNQYDILIDDTIPTWNDVENPTVRPCEIIR